jgi:general secretion pathway protein E
MVGEMRDGETADIAVHAALTGHLVLSTLHTNSAAGAISRLLDMGVEPFLLTSCLRAVIGQRLVRTLCPECKRPAGDGSFTAAGCPSCGDTGYLGRVGLFEIMPITEELRKLTLGRDGSNAIEMAARAAGMRTMAEDGAEKITQGLTSREEVRRVVELI